MSVTWPQLRQPESFQTLTGLLLETEWFPVENHCSVLWLLVTQLCVTLCNPMDCSLPGSSIHVIFQARILEHLAIILLWGIFQPRDWTWIFCLAGGFFTVWATRKSISGQHALLVSNMAPVVTTIKSPGIGRFTFGDRMIWKLRTAVLNIF